jgi:hypothetical protein
MPASRQNLLNLAQHHPAMVRQGGFSAAAVEQTQAQVNLKMGNRAAHGGLAFAQLAGGG